MPEHAATQYYNKSRRTAVSRIDHRDRVQWNGNPPITIVVHDSVNLSDLKPVPRHVVGGQTMTDDDCDNNNDDSNNYCDRRMGGGRCSQPTVLQYSTVEYSRAAVAYEECMSRGYHVIYAVVCHWCASNTLQSTKAPSTPPVLTAALSEKNLLSCKACVPTRRPCIDLNCINIRIRHRNIWILNIYEWK